MDRNEQIRRGQGLISINGKFHLELQTNGNLALYSNGALLWSTQTSTGDRFVMQNDGNLVLYERNGRSLFLTKTDGSGRYFLLQNDGNMVVYDSRNSAKWLSNTNHCNSLFLFSNT